MANFATSLKGEIARVARREIKSDVQALRKTVAGQRADIAQLKRLVKELSQQVKAANKAAAKAVASAPVPAETESKRRVSGQGLDPSKLKEFRTANKLTQEDMAFLVGASTLSVSKWESGNTIPRAAQVARITPVLKMGKRAVKAQIAARKDVGQGIA